MKIYKKFACIFRNEGKPFMVSDLWFLCTGSKISSKHIIQKEMGFIHAQASECRQGNKLEADLRLRSCRNFGASPEQISQRTTPYKSFPLGKLLTFQS